MSTIFCRHCGAMFVVDGLFIYGQNAYCNNCMSPNNNRSHTFHGDKQDCIICQYHAADYYDVPDDEEER